MGVSIEHILETHNHADHVSGHGRLAAATGATIHIHRARRARLRSRAVRRRLGARAGQRRVRALHTPGHRPEHTVFALIDTARGPEPWALLTGDTLFVGDVARPDLAVEKRDGARGIFHSLHDTLLALPDACEVWPGHLGGSLCGGPGMDMKVSSTIGYERAHNALLGSTTRTRSSRAPTASLPPQPPNFQAIVAINRGPQRHHRRGASRMTPHEVEASSAESGAPRRRPHRPPVRRGSHPGRGLQPGGARGLRHQARLGGRPRARGHLRRARRPGRPARRPPGRAVGITSIAGHLAGGMTSWREERRPTARSSASTSARCTSAPTRSRSSTCASGRVGARPHRRLGPGPLPRGRRHPGRDRPRPAHRGHLLVRPARAVAASLLQRSGAEQPSTSPAAASARGRRSGWPRRGTGAGRARDQT